MVLPTVAEGARGRRLLVKTLLVVDNQYVEGSKALKEVDICLRKKISKNLKLENCLFVR